MLFRSRRVYAGDYNQGSLLLNSMSIGTTPSSSNLRVLFSISLVLDGAVSSVMEHSTIDGNSIASYAAPALAAAPTLSSYITLFSTTTTEAGTKDIDLSKYRLQVDSNRSLYVIYSCSDPGSGNIDLRVALNFIDDA